MNFIKRNNTLDLFKLIACVMIIFIHSPFPEPIGGGITVIARFGVPFFLMTSGALSVTSSYSLIIKKRIIKLLKIFLASMTFYIGFNFAVNAVKGNIIDYLLTLTNFRTWCNILLFNYVTPVVGVGHLWYLSCIIYTYIISLFVDKFNLWNLTKYISVLLVLLFYVMELLNFSQIVCIDTYFYRNYIFEGFPFFTFGRIIQERLQQEKWSLNINSTLSVIAIYVALYFVETKLFGYKLELYIHTIILSTLLLSIGLTCRFKESFIITIGRKYTTWIYVFHYVIVILIGALSEKLLPSSLMVIKPIAVVFVCYAMSVLYERFVTLIGKKSIFLSA